jgi:hypothetical protein
VKAAIQGCRGLQDQQRKTMRAMMTMFKQEMPVIVRFVARVGIGEKEGGFVE